MPELDVGWSDCEKGNTWLTNGEGDHYALIDITSTQRLEIVILLDNYPGLNVAIIDKTDAEMAAHIQDRYEGWTARKCNVEGVKIDGNIIGTTDNNKVTDEDEDDDEDMHRVLPPDY